MCSKTCLEPFYVFTLPKRGFAKLRPAEAVLTYTTAHLIRLCLHSWGGICKQGSWQAIRALNRIAPYSVSVMPAQLIQKIKRHVKQHTVTADILGVLQCTVINIKWKPLGNTICRSLCSIKL